jgi:hypothetical protein
MNKSTIVNAVASVILGVVCFVGFNMHAQSNLTTGYTEWTKGYQDQSTYATINHRQGDVVGFFKHSVHGATAGAYTSLNRTLPDGAILGSNGCVEILAAMLPAGVYTGAIYAGSTKIYESTNWYATSAAYILQIPNMTKLTEDSELKVIFTGTAPTSSLAFQVHIPYTLGNAVE